MEEIQTKPSDRSINRFIGSSSVSGAFWRSSEIAVMSGLKLKKPVLDLGCGNGRYADIVFDGTIDIGLDISHRAIKEARKNNVYGKYIVSDANNIPLPDKSVNSVFSNSVFEHISDLKPVIKEVGRILSKGGHLVFTTHAPLSKRYFGASLLKKLRLDKLAFWYKNYYLHMHQLKTTWSLKRWREELGRAKLKIVVSKETISPGTAFWYELFMPISFLQNRLPVLKKNSLSRTIFRIINPDYKSTCKNGRNYYIEAVKL